MSHIIYHTSVIPICVDIARLLSNASDIRIKALGSPCALAK